jgi:anti-sigma regulatory factor (Ser/Thr protein kinase)
MALLLDHDLAMVGVARRAVRTWLHGRGCHACDDAVLVLSELVANAMVHAEAGCTIEVWHGGDRVRLEVSDRSRTAPALRLAAPSAVGGRGLQVVESIAEAWGWTATLDGKCVWAVVHAAADDLESPSS